MPYCTPWSARELLFLQNNYPNKGKVWCAEQLGRTPKAVAGKVDKLQLKLDQDGEHFKEYQQRAAQSKVGKKSPEHAERMRQKWASGEMNNRG